MSTLFKRLRHYCHNNHHELPAREDRLVLGKRILDAWFAQSEIKLPLHYKPSEEPEGTFKVLSYPDVFIPQIDQIIEAYFKEISPPKKEQPPVKKERKRIPLRVPENKKFKFYPKAN
jgi:hypothetical protein